MFKSKKFILLTLFAILSTIALSQEPKARKRIYHSGSGEIILSGANILYSGVHGNVDVNTNLRFTLFFHTQQMINYDLNDRIGLYTGVALRNIGLITEDKYQYLGFTGVDQNHENWNVNTKIKRRSYSLGFPLAVKVGSIKKHTFLYAGGEYEWMFHYKQKLFMDGNKTKYAEWGSDRVNPWVPSLFVGIQFPGGLNLKAKYYMKDFLNRDFRGKDFGQDVDYSQFQSTGIWYVSLAMIISKEKMKKLREEQKLRFSRVAQH